jgi:uncharacterized protein
MADNASTVTAIYEAFGQGDVPTILERLRDDVEWERGASPTGIPWLEPGHGKDHVQGFFGALAEHLEFRAFAPTGMAVGDDVVVAFVALEAEVKRTGRVISESAEAHCWWFDDAGLVTAFRHYVDVPQHQAAFGDAA